MKRFIAATIFILIFSTNALAEYWGSKMSDKYHRPNCEWAQKISKANKVVFKTPEEAKKAGYKPCKVCRPPVK